jgi:hypothetical protein
MLNTIHVSNLLIFNLYVQEIMKVYRFKWRASESFTSTYNITIQNIELEPT